MFPVQRLLMTDLASRPLEDDKPDVFGSREATQEDAAAQPQH
jgi:hypothetical protein